jgi:hypothetical protein
MTDVEFWDFQRRLREARNAKPVKYAPRFAHLKFQRYAFMKPYANFLPGPEEPKHVDILFHFWHEAGEPWQDSKLVIASGFIPRQRPELQPDGTYLAGYTDLSGTTHLLTLEVLNAGHLESDGRQIKGAEVTLTIDGGPCYRSADFYWHGDPNDGHSPDVGDWTGITACRPEELPDDVKGVDRYVLLHFAVVREDIGGLADINE